MEALNLFKQAGIEDFLQGAKNEWDQGDFLKPMAIGAGVGGLGYGANALMQGGKKESGGDKTKRVLSEMLKGVGYGGLAGGAYGGASHLGKLMFGDPEQQKPVEGPAPERAPSAVPQPPPADKSKEPPAYTISDVKKDQEKSPISTTLQGAGYGLGAGTAVGGASGFIRDKILPNSDISLNPEVIRGEQLSRLVGQDGAMHKNLHSFLGNESTNPSQSQMLGANGSPFRSGSSARIQDLVKGITETVHPQVAGEAIGYSNKLLGNMTNGTSPGSLAEQIAAARNLGASGPIPDHALLQALSDGGRAKTFEELPSIARMIKLKTQAGQPKTFRYGGWGGLIGAGVGTATGGILGFPTSNPSVGAEYDTSPGKWSLGRSSE